VIPRRCPARLAFMLEWRVRRWLLAPSRLLRSLPLRPGVTVLDIGAGSGVVAEHLAGAIEHGAIVLLDAQHAMLERARRRLRAGPRVRLGFVRAVAERLPLADASADAAVMATVLGELDDAGAALSEVYRVLRSGGVLAIAEHLPDPDFRSAGRARALAAAAGFTVGNRVGGRWSYTLAAVKP